MNRARILLLTTGVGPFDYRVPDGMQAEPGMLVDVPLGPRRITGLVLNADEYPAPDVDAAKLRPLLHVHAVPPLPRALQQLIRWTSEYYLAHPAAVARMAAIRTTGAGAHLYRISRDGRFAAAHDAAAQPSDGENR
jgi:primosomal protein N' (replication factor Y) (superfamily II helicase)